MARPSLDMHENIAEWTQGKYLVRWKAKATVGTMQREYDGKLYGYNVIFWEWYTVQVTSETTVQPGFCFSLFNQCNSLFTMFSSKHSMHKAKHTLSERRQRKTTMKERKKERNKYGLPTEIDHEFRFCFIGKISGRRIPVWDWCYPGFQTKVV